MSFKVKLNGYRPALKDTLSCIYSKSRMFEFQILTVNHIWLKAYFFWVYITSLRTFQLWKDLLTNLTDTFIKKPRMLDNEIVPCET